MVVVVDGVGGRRESREFGSMKVMMEWIPVAEMDNEIGHSCKVERTKLSSAFFAAVDWAADCICYCNIVTGERVQAPKGSG